MSIPQTLGSLELARLIGRAMADNGRLRILSALRGREVCVCHLAELLGLDQSTISRHLAVLREAGLILARREGRWVHYRRAEGGEETYARAFSLIDALVEGATEIQEDARRLTSICCLPKDGSSGDK